MPSDDDIWGLVFLQGDACRLCTFNEPTILTENNRKRVIRECVAARAEHCPEVKRAHEGANNVKA